MITGNDLSVVVSTRVRYARNIEDYPFDLSGSRVMRDELVLRIKEALGTAFQEEDMQTLSPNKRLCLCEQHRISPEFMKSAVGTLFSKEKEGIYLMALEEDHIRLQVIDKGYCPAALLQKADDVIANLENKLRFSFDDKLGYLTRCPTNLGHGLRFSVMVFLPGLTSHAEIAGLQQNLFDLGFNLRGMYGEGSKSGGCLYQISNRGSLGMTKEALLCEFDALISRVISAEMMARQRFDRDILLDSAGRAYGILAYACKMTYEEFLGHYANLRTGYAFDLDLPKYCNMELLDELLILLSPGMIHESFSCKNSEQRDLERAKLLKMKVRGDWN